MVEEIKAQLESSITGPIFGEKDKARCFDAVMYLRLRGMLEDEESTALYKEIRLLEHIFDFFSTQLSQAELIDQFPISVIELDLLMAIASLQESLPYYLDVAAKPDYAALLSCRLNPYKQKWTKSRPVAAQIVQDCARHRGGPGLGIVGETLFRLVKKVTSHAPVHDAEESFADWSKKVVLAKNVSEIAQLFLESNPNCRSMMDSMGDLARFFVNHEIIIDAKYREAQSAKWDEKSKVGPFGEIVPVYDSKRKCFTISNTAARKDAIHAYRKEGACLFGQDIIDLDLGHEDDDNCVQFIRKLEKLIPKLKQGKAPNHPFGESEYSFIRTALVMPVVINYDDEVIGEDGKPRVVSKDDFPAEAQEVEQLQHLLHDYAYEAATLASKLKSQTADDWKRCFTIIRQNCYGWCHDHCTLADAGWIAGVFVSASDKLYADAEVESNGLKRELYGRICSAISAGERILSETLEKMRQIEKGAARLKVSNDGMCRFMDLTRIDLIPAVIEYGYFDEADEYDVLKIEVLLEDMAELQFKSEKPIVEFCRERIQLFTKEIAYPSPIYRGNLIEGLPESFMDFAERFVFEAKPEQKVDSNTAAADSITRYKRSKSPTDRLGNEATFKLEMEMLWLAPSSVWRFRRVAQLLVKAIHRATMHPFNEKLAQSSWLGWGLLVLAEGPLADVPVRQRDYSPIKNDIDEDLRGVVSELVEWHRKIMRRKSVVVKKGVNKAFFDELGKTFIESVVGDGDLTFFTDENSPEPGVFDEYPFEAMHEALGSPAPDESKISPKVRSIMAMLNAELNGVDDDSFIDKRFNDEFEPLAVALGRPMSFNGAMVTTDNPDVPNRFSMEEKDGILVVEDRFNNFEPYHFKSGSDAASAVKTLIKDYSRGIETTRSPEKGWKGAFQSRKGMKKPEAVRFKDDQIFMLPLYNVERKSWPRNQYSGLWRLWTNDEMGMDFDKRIAKFMKEHPTGINKNK